MGLICSSSYNTSTATSVELEDPQVPISMHAMSKYWYLTRHLILFNIHEVEEYEDVYVAVKIAFIKPYQNLYNVAD